MQVTIQSKINGSWTKVPAEKEPKLFEQLKSFAGTETIAELCIDLDGRPYKEYYCCNEELFKKLCITHQSDNTKIIASGNAFSEFVSSSLHNKAIRTFWTKDDVALAFPEKKNGMP
jgi:hypothetical protein